MVPSVLLATPCRCHLYYHCRHHVTVLVTVIATGSITSAEPQTEGRDLS